MLRNLVRPLIVVALAGGAIAMAACDDDPDPEEARVAVCEDAAAVDQARDVLEALGDSNTFDDFEAAAEDLASALDDFESSAEDYLDANDALVDTYVSTLQDLDDAIDNLSSDMTISEARAEIQEEYDAAVAARDAIIDSANC